MDVPLAAVASGPRNDGVHPVVTSASRGAAEVWYAQFETLVRKNSAILRHRRITTLLLLAVPMAFVLGLVALHNALPSSTANDIPLGTVPRCDAFSVYGTVDSGVDCVTIGYAPTGTAVDGMMQHIGRVSGLAVGSDIRGFESPAVLAAFIHSNVGVVSVWAGVAFNATALAAGRFQYELWVNASAAMDYASSSGDELYSVADYSGRYLALQNAVDEAVIAAVSGNDGARLDVTVGVFTDFTGGIATGACVQCSKLDGSQVDMLCTGR